MFRCSITTKVGSSECWLGDMHRQIYWRSTEETEAQENNNSKHRKQQHKAQEELHETQETETASAK